MTQGPFTISLQIHHLQRDLNILTEALGRTPVFCFTAGQSSGNSIRRTSVWHAQLSHGQTREEFEHALETLLQYIETHRDVLAEFAGDDAHMEVLLSFSVAPTPDLAHSVQLHPFLLYQLASQQIGVKVQTVAHTL